MVDGTGSEIGSADLFYGLFNGGGSENGTTILEGRIAKSLLGDPSSSVKFHWTMSCGNDMIELQGNPVPEPASMMLMGTGLAALVGFKKRKSRRNDSVTITQHDLTQVMAGDLWPIEIGEMKDEKHNCGDHIEESLGTICDDFEPRDVAVAAHPLHPPPHPLRGAEDAGGRADWFGGGGDSAPATGGWNHHHATRGCHGHRGNLLLPTPVPCQRNTAEQYPASGKSVHRNTALHPERVHEHDPVQYPSPGGHGVASAHRWRGSRPGDYSNSDSNNQRNSDTHLHPHRESHQDLHSASGRYSNPIPHR
ncbi:MAG: PEP-CTERM sorting domain-containing protein, partial [Candidatus Omnitrophica bacterium]|nr:PEP-CTERM sorting domain-containing protein [Candidatus Omnitrophota bacterium]